ncbi:hypothetical protein JL721_6474 [Aureococcus anophagefferens]|nr:hypothetical protein JL721_6474 [Aureococcus anophagefferens]
MARKYNMKGESTAAKQKVEDVDDSAAVPTIRGELKAAFATGDVSTRDFRMRQLLKFRDMLVAGRGPLLDALQQDLHKSHTEGWMMELNQLEHEAQEAIDSLDAWMRPERVGTNVVNVPGASYVHSDPLGVVLVIGGAVLDARWDHIFFTGGKTVGRMVAKAAAEHLCPTSLELGGKSPCVVDKSCDVAVAARRICWGLFTNCGQTCAEVAAFYGPTPPQSPYYGRIVNDRAFDRVAALVADARASGAAVHGGATDRATRYVEPTLVDYGCDAAAFEASALMADEIFGPVCPILRYASLDADALPVVAKREKPLSFYLFAGDAEVREKLQWATTSGAFVVNDVITHLGGSRRNSSLPFGGVGESGMGNYHGHYSFKTFSHQKAVLHKTPYLDLPARYPPYDSTKDTMLAVLQHPRYGPDRLLSLVPPAVKKALGVAAAVYVAKKLAPAVLATESGLLLEYVKGRRRRAAPPRAPRRRAAASGLRPARDERDGAAARDRFGSVSTPPPSRRAKAGELDWRVENVGAVSHAVYQQRRCYALTRAGGGQALVAALNTRTGGVEWRRALPPGEAGDGVVVAGNAAVTLSGRGLRPRGGRGFGVPRWSSPPRTRWPWSARKLSWARDEALAHVTSAAFVDAPPLERAAPSEGAIPSFARRRSDRAAPSGSAFDALFSIFRDAAALKEAKKLANARRYGFDKLAVLANADAGKVFAVGMHTGATAWSALVPKNAAVSVVKRGDRPELGVFARGVGVSYLDAHRGAPIGGAQPLPAADVLIPTRGRPASGRDAYLAAALEDDGAALEAVPAAAGAAIAASRPRRSTSTSSTRPGALRCFMVAPAVYAPSSSGPSSSRAGRATRSSRRARRRRPVSSKAPRLGDDALLLKYLNPHLAVVLSSSPGGAPAPLLDAKLRVADVARDQVEPPTPRIDGFRLEPAAARRAPADLRPPKPVTALGATATSRGIASKHVLLGVEPGQLSALDRRALDPRRPNLDENDKSRAARKRVERELDEGLRPYAPFVPLAPRSVVTYDQQILKLNAIYATDAKLESTSLVLATGVDVFGCRHMPSGAFDLIADDFNYARLLLLLLGLSLARSSSARPPRPRTSPSSGSRRARSVTRF